MSGEAIGRSCVRPAGSLPPPPEIADCVSEGRGEALFKHDTPTARNLREQSEPDFPQFEGQLIGHVGDNQTEY
jgi:hypothetical protein